MIHALVLVVALYQDAKPQEKPKETEAEALFRGIREKAAAKTLSWKSTARIAGKKEDLALTIEGAFKDGNKARLSGEGGAITFSITCDGAKACFESSKLGDKVSDAPKDYAAGLRDLWLRGGLIAFNFLPQEAIDAEKLRALAVVSDLALEKDEKVGDRDARVLTYQVKMGERSASVRLWVDARTLAPIKRATEGSDKMVISEEWTTWTLDGELKDDLFKIK